MSMGRSEKTRGEIRDRGGEVCNGGGRTGKREESSGTGSELTAYPAECFGGDAEKRGDQMLRDPVDAEGVVFQKSRVFLFCSQSQRIVDASLMSHKCVLEKNPCVGIESRYSIEQLLMVLLIDHQEFTLLKGFYIEFGDLIGQKAVEIGNPPAFKTELKHLLTALLIGRVGEQSPFFDEPETGADIPLLKQKLPSAQPFWTEAVSALIPLFICEISMFGNATVEFFKHGLRDHRKFSKNRASPDAMPDPYTPSRHRPALAQPERSEEHTSELQSRG